LNSSFSIRVAMALIYPSRWYQEGITVCCILTRYSSSLQEQLNMPFHTNFQSTSDVWFVISNYCSYLNMPSSRRRLEPLVDMENWG
jgi:hypothetical protein